MKKRRLYKYAVDLFVDTLREVTKRPRFEYRCNDADTGCWDGFIDEFGDNVGEGFIKDFLMFGFQSWFNDSCNRDYSKSIRFSWIFGRSAINRWRKNEIGTNLYIVRKSKIKQRINRRRGKTAGGNIVLCVRPIEERFKAEFFNTRRGFSWCIVNTTLYFHKSVKCCACNFKKECKEVLKLNYPLIYKKRGYE